MVATGNERHALSARKMRLRLEIPPMKASEGGNRWSEIALRSAAAPSYFFSFTLHPSTRVNRALPYF
jgi:patatin-like phospholipase/acyl hydrolase